MKFGTVGPNKLVQKAPECGALHTLRALWFRLVFFCALFVEF